MASALTSQLTYRFTDTQLSSQSRCVFGVCSFTYSVVIVCIICCGAVYNLCLVLFINNNKYMYLNVHTCDLFT